MGMDDYGDEDEVDTCFSADLLLPDQQVMMIAHGVFLGGALCVLLWFYDGDAVEQLCFNK